MYYKLSKEADEDLSRIYSYGIFKFGMRQADLYYDQLIESFEFIVKNPLLYPVIRVNRVDYRKCICGSDVIYYRIMNDYIEIATIMGAQDFQDFE